MADEILRLAVLGCATPYPSVDNPCSGYLVSGGGVNVWVDAGSGTLGPLQRHARLDESDAIWISHLHADHSADLLTAYDTVPGAAPPWWTGRVKIFPYRVLRALERFNAAHPWDHNAHYHRWILRQLPRRFGRALDVGSGAGDLARLLAGRAEAVVGVDADPAITARARRSTPPTARVDFTVADALTGIPAGRYEVVTCVATVHHLPFAEALAEFRRHLSPGGTLVIVGLSRADTPADHLLGLAAVPLNALAGYLKNRGRPAPRPAAMTAPTRAADMTFRQIAAEARTVLPGARLRRRLFWRYTLVWRNG